MKRRLALVCLVGIASAAALGLQQQGLQPQQAQAAGRPPCVSWSGPDSKVESRRFVRVRDGEAWRALWGEHVGKDEVNAHPVWQTAPQVDFARFEVVAFFRGRATNTNGERIVGIDDTPDGVRIRFDSASYQTASFDGPDPGVSCTPYGIWVIDRTAQTIIVEEDVQGLIGHPPKWKEQTRLTP